MADWNKAPHSSVSERIDRYRTENIRLRAALIAILCHPCAPSNAHNGTFGNDVEGFAEFAERRARAALEPPDAP